MKDDNEKEDTLGITQEDIDDMIEELILDINNTLRR